MEGDVRTKAATPAPRYDVPSGGRLLLGWALILAGAIMLGVGWFGVSGNPLVAAQLAYLASGGLGGLLAGIVGIGLLVSNDVRKDRERLGRLEAAVLEMRELIVAQAEARSHVSENGEKATEPSGRVPG